MRTIEPRFLISEDLAVITKEVSDEDQAINIYLHNKSGSAVVFGGNFGKQEINTAQRSPQDEQFAKNIFMTSNRKNKRSVKNFYFDRIVEK